MSVSLPPGILLIAGALLLPLLPPRLRGFYPLVLVVLSALNLAALDATDAAWRVALFDYELVLAKTDSLSLLFGWLFHIGAFLAFLFALHLRDPVQQVAALVYAGAGMGAVGAGDWITFFVHWEVMTGASMFLIWARQGRRALAAALRYFGVQLLSGLLLLAGILVHFAEGGGPALGYVGLGSLGGVLILIALGVKCAFPALHVWMIDAYPESTPTGTVFLSIFSTKTAVYALAMAFPGAAPLVPIGIAMTIFPIFYAVIENDFRRVLCYSSVNQLGFMVAGIGLGSALAVNGAVAHAFAEVLFKGLLFMSMGAVLHVTGRVKGSELGGLYKTMPMTTAFCSVGALAIAGMPAFSAFVTKSMVLEAFAEKDLWIAWLLLMFASAGVVEHASIKIPFFTFFGPNRRIAAREPPAHMLAAMALAALLSILIGCYPDALYRLLPYPVAYKPFAATHIVTQLQLLFFAALAVFTLMQLKLYPPELRSTNLDFDWFARRLAWPAARRSGLAALALSERMHGLANHLAARGLAVLLHIHGPRGVLARTWLTGSTVLWIAALLGAYLIISYL